jgi:hypothetical protein
VKKLLTISQEAIETLQELKRMSQLNYELLEQLSVTCKWMIENDIQSPNISRLCSLLSKADSLLAEIKADEPKNLVYQKLSRRMVTDRNWKNRTDEDVTEPSASAYKGMLLYTRRYINKVDTGSTNDQTTTENLDSKYCSVSFFEPEN